MSNQGAALEDRLVALYEALDAGSSDPGSTLLEIARLHIDVGEPLKARSAIGRLVSSDASFRSWVAATQLLERLRAEAEAAGATPLRVSLLGTSTLDQLGPLVELAGAAVGIDLRVQVGPYGQIESEVLHPDSQFHDYDPDVVILAPDARGLPLPPSTDDVSAVVEEALQRWTSVWGALQQGRGAQVLHLNLVPPLERPLGNLEAVDPGSRWGLVATLNRELALAAERMHVHTVDTFGLAALYGIEQWTDDRYWFHAKQAVALGALPRLAREIVAVLQASLGRAKKCIVVDLDNTLWGGVVGDDGVANLRLEGSAVGEAHLALQKYLSELKDRGVLLAVCSKNDEQTARAPFLEREDMRLGLDDFVAFIANWEPKSDNLRLVADQLDIGLEALVFLDDNPAERALIRQQMPQVDVIELPSDPSGFLRTLASYRGFEAVAITGEDRNRTDQYRARTAAAEAQAASGSFEDYLQGLDMVADVAPVDRSSLPRVAQLVGKTNQWNLTTRRHPADVLERYVDDRASIVLSLRLRDRFADHGLVAAIIATPVDDALDIDTFVMSCRVIGRTVERSMLDALLVEAEDRGVEEIRATYIRTPRNGVVADLYGRLGFDHVGASEQATYWKLSLAERSDALNPFIRMEVRS